MYVTKGVFFTSDKIPEEMTNLFLQFLTKMIVLFLKFGMAVGGRNLKGLRALIHEEIMVKSSISENMACEGNKLATPKLKHIT